MNPVNPVHPVQKIQFFSNDMQKFMSGSWFNDKNRTLPLFGAEC
jgi:hypothetical protein